MTESLLKHKDLIKCRPVISKFLYKYKDIDYSNFELNMNLLCINRLFPNKSMLDEYSQSDLSLSFTIPSFDELNSKIGILKETYERLMKTLKNNRKISSKYVCSYVSPSQLKTLNESSTEGIKWLYIGQCKSASELAEGIGMQIWSNGELYFGYYLNDEIYYQGRYVYSNGNIYEGQIKKSKRHGYGEYSFPDGDKYIGEFSNNKLNGKGRYIWADGTIEHATYSFGKPVGKAQIEYSDGRKITIDYNDDKSESSSKKNKITSKNTKK